MTRPEPDRLATLLRCAAALALGLLFLGAAAWKGNSVAQRAGVVLLLAAPWTVVAHAAWTAWHAGRRGPALLALALLAVATTALVLGLG